MPESNKILVGFKFPYSISSFGILKNMETGKIRKFQTNPKDPYPYLVLKTDKDTFTKVRLHRLLAEYFIPNPQNLPCVNHKDGNKLNNALENLEWISYSNNAKHAYSTGLKIPALPKNRKLNSSDIASIRIMYSTGTSMRIIGELFKVSRTAISEIIHKRQYKEIV